MAEERKVLVTTSSFGKADPAPLEGIRGAGFEPVPNPHGRKLTEDEVLGLIKEHSPVGMVAGVEPLTARVLEAAERLKVVSRCGIGLDSVDLCAAERLKIRVLNTPDAPSSAVAELAVALMLAVLRQVGIADRSIREGRWKPLMGRLLGGRTVGLIGCGRVGRKVAAACRAFGAGVVGYDPYAAGPEGMEPVSFDVLLARADVISLHLPYGPDTRHMIDAGAFRKMRPGTVLINTSRGGLVDEEALREAILSGKVYGAGLDTFETEPYLGPLRDLPNVVMTAHMGSYAEESRARMEAEAAENLIKGLREAGVGII